MPVSISSFVTVPDLTMRMALRICGTMRRLTIKPGVSLVMTTVLPRDLPNVLAVVIVTSLVASVLTISSSFIAGTGLKKWIPSTLSLRAVTDAISDTGRQEVFVANIAFFWQTLSIWLNIC